MSTVKIDPERFLLLSENISVCAVRSPSEYNAGLIPGSVNIPIFSDRERESVGIRYKNEGRIAAIKEGLDLAGASRRRAPRPGGVPRGARFPRGACRAQSGDQLRLRV